ncbi:MAG TPA: choice-of-anchor tandem repeat GloVer-containing protein [Candidatus Binatus sp.]|nr:choice-of-anchor tandem repeat GloVer-containing protein [Candidatus Binatus sp.]
MFSYLRIERRSLVAVIVAAISLTLAPVARAQTETILYNFGLDNTGKCNKIDDGADPKGSLTYVPATGLLFGRTSSTTSPGNGDGTIFQIMPNGTGYVVDHFFTGTMKDGIDPRHNAMTLVGSVLYGTTLEGGGNANGTIFSINDDGSGYSIPSLFQFPATSKHNGGTQPHSCFVAIGNVLYGMTSQGGKNGPPGDGTIFSFDPTSSTYTRLHTFDGKHGSNPHGQLIVDPSGSPSYGMTRSGGKHDVGIIFSLGVCSSSGAAKCTPKFKVLHDFTCPGNSTPTCTDKNDGATPDHGTLVQSNSTLYGLTTDGGKYGNGALFSIDTNGKHFTILHSFGQPTTTDGINPFGSLTLNGTTLYGTTQLGGNKNNGTVFQIDTDGTNYARVYDFQNGNDGMKPIDDVLLLDNTLYGMTEKGGMCGDGAIFAIALP